MNAFTSSRFAPILLLTCSNIFMTFAWYGHLKYSRLHDGGVMSLWKVILLSWGVAFLEYLFMVPANRWGSVNYSPAELKIMQEVITLIVFAFFAVLYLGEKFRWNHFAAFLCILGAVAFTVLPKK